MKRLIIVGAGGFGREVFAWASAHPDCGNQWTIQGFLDDDASVLDGLDYPVGIIGTVQEYEACVEDVLVCGIGTPSVKKRVCGHLQFQGSEFISLVHPTAVIGQNVQLGDGVIVCPQVVITADVEVGDFVTINCHSSVGHDARIGDWTTISSQCDITGNVEIGAESFLGSGARIIPSKKIGAQSLVGVGAVVIRNVKPNTKVFGNPARVFA